MDNIITLGNESILAEGVSKKIAEYEKALKELKEKEDLIKESIKSEMEAKGIIKIENDDLLINYVAPTDRIAFDSARFKKEHPDIYDEYLRISPVKASIRIKVK